MIIVLGSINIDMVFQVDELPQPGETVIAGSYETLNGGKGANQALAAARSGLKVMLVGCVGNDATTTRMLRFLRRDGVAVSGVGKREDTPTGCAVIHVDNQGENQIVVASGANSCVEAAQIPDEVLHEGNVLLSQMELPLDVVKDVMKRGRQGGATTVLNYAPARSYDEELLSYVDYLIVNEVEISQLAAHSGMGTSMSSQDIARQLAEKYGGTYVVTLGAKGALAAQADGQVFTAAALAVEDVVDRTGAGDAFCGLFAACIHAGMDVADALRWGCAAGSLTCTKKGAQAACPYIADIGDALEEGLSAFL